MKAMLTQADKDAYIAHLVACRVSGDPSPNPINLKELFPEWVNELVEYFYRNISKDSFETISLRFGASLPVGVRLDDLDIKTFLIPVLTDVERTLEGVKDSEKVKNIVSEVIQALMRGASPKVLRKLREKATAAYYATAANAAHAANAAASAAITAAHAAANAANAAHAASAANAAATAAANAAHAATYAAYAANAAHAASAATYAATYATNAANAANAASAASAANAEWDKHRGDALCRYFNMLVDIVGAKDGCKTIGQVNIEI